MADSDWVAALRSECAKTSQGKVALRLQGCSSALINRVLKGKYPHDTARLEARVRGELMNKTVTCPVLGQISSRQCQDEQVRPFAATNPQRVQLHRACRSGCPNFVKGGS